MIIFKNFVHFLWGYFHYAALEFITIFVLKSCKIGACSIQGSNAMAYQSQPLLMKQICMFYSIDTHFR